MNIGKSLLSILPPERVKIRLIDLVSYASDAGFYHLQPKAIVQPVSEEEVKSLFCFSQAYKIPITFRTGGTSLSGQSITDGILVDLSQYWRNVKTEQEGKIVRVQPGVIGSMVNAHLKKYKTKIGPDPSSINSAMMGGILSNNSSGMCCGVHLNSYHTAKYIRFILPDGRSYSNEIASDYVRFETESVPIFQTLKNIRESINGNQPLKKRITEKYKTKNTVGYSLNSFIDYEHPLDIFAHLLIGAEGTLAFIAEAVMETVPDYPYKSTALFCFHDIYAACQAIVPLTESGAEAVELMDRASLYSIQKIKNVPAIIRELPENAAALLVEYQSESVEELKEKVDKFEQHTSGLSLIVPAVFTEDPVEQAFLWKLRKGMFPAVGAIRASGSTVILEDIAFPVPRLGDAILDLQRLFKKYNYDNAIIFGHAKDGNIHFVITQFFNIPSEIARYEAFMDEVVRLVINKYDGTLKAEHGTGRNMAPFVETEWGSEAYQIMKTLKNIVDPSNLLNPGVIINKDKKAHLKNLKELPVVEEEVDKCIECGYCEHKCPSRDLTLTPRRRIVVRRALATLSQAADNKRYNQLVKEYQYDGLDTCAVDGLCATDCPVDINTGDLVKRLRRESHSRFANQMALMVAYHFQWAESIVKTALKSGAGINTFFGTKTMFKITGALKKVLPSVPIWTSGLTGPPEIPYQAIEGSEAQFVYFPTCISRTMGNAKDDKKNLVQTLLSVAGKAGINVIIPNDINGHCCGQPFSSKGYNEAFAFTTNKIIETLWKWTGNGKLPVILDVSSCTHTLHHCRAYLSAANQAKFDCLVIIDSLDFLYDFVLTNSKVLKPKSSVVLHPVCSLQKMDLNAKFLKIAQYFAIDVTVPASAGCCGMAGDRGFLFPELTASATKTEAMEVKDKSFDGYYSSAKTCEMAMSEAVGKNYESILYLADEVM